MTDEDLKLQAAEAKRAVIQGFIRMVGYCPIGLQDTLSILAHPDVFNLTEEWLEKEKLIK